MFKRALSVLASMLVLAGPADAASQGGPLPGPLPLLPASNWWNLDITSAPVDPGSAAFIDFIGPTRGLHPDFGGEESPGSVNIYGMPYVLVNSSQPKVAVEFEYWDESDGVNMQTGQGIPFYPIPPEAITQPHWIEGGAPGNQNVGGDRHMLIVDTDNKLLYELFALFWDGAKWTAGSGALFDLKTNNRRPEGWTSADAAGLAILPGLVRYDEAFGAAEIGHAFRVTVRATNGHVFPASHTAGSTSGALPMGARLRLKAGKNIAAFTPEVQRIFRAMKKHGLVVADNGSDMYVSGTFDTRWNNDILNPAFGALEASDFEVVQLAWNPPSCSPPTLSVTDVSVNEGNSASTMANFVVSLSGPACAGGPVTVTYATVDGTASAGSDYGVVNGSLTIPAGQLNGGVGVPILADRIQEANETFTVNLSSPTGASLGDGVGVGSIQNDDSAGLSVADAVVRERRNGQSSATFVVTLSPASGTTVTVNAGTAGGSATSGLDFTATSLPLTFDPGVTTRTITVPVLSDALAERMETFFVNLTGESGAAVVVGQATGRILEPQPAGDLNGDGSLDLLWQRSPDGSLLAWYMAGLSRSSFSYLSPAVVSDPNWKIVGTGLFDAGSQADLVWQHQTSGALLLWYMNGVTRQSWAALNPGAVTDPNWKVMGTGDFDDDGRPDLVWRNGATGAIVVWYMNDATRTGVASIQPPMSDGNWLLGAVADLSGDGRPDLVWQHRTSGLLVAWTIVGGVRTKAAVLSPSTLPASGLGWRIVSAPDLNDDGKPDLLWRHETTGDLLVWYMNGLVRASYAYLNPSTVPDLSWKIVGPR